MFLFPVPGKKHRCGSENREGDQQGEKYGPVPGLFPGFCRVFRRKSCALLGGGLLRGFSLRLRLLHFRKRQLFG